ncbi:MAG: hypothetical protein ACTSRI_16790 [Promethearchaeota archaeon]
MEQNKINYLVYFLTYFAINVTRTYFTVYIPVYFFNILNVDRSELAFVQFLSYSTLFVAPVMGYFFDTKIRKKKLIIAFCSFLMVFSFFIFVFNTALLAFFGIFLGFNLAVQELIRVGVNKLMIKSSSTEKIRDYNILVIYGFGSLGIVIPGLIFTVNITEMFTQNFWNWYFLIGAILTSPILFLLFLFKDDISEVVVSQEKKEKTIKKVSILPVILLFATHFFIWGDKLIQYPFNAWILENFGREGLAIYCVSLVFYVYINLLGFYMAKQVSNDNNRKKIVILSTSCYALVFTLLPFTNLVVFLILYGFVQILAGLMMFNLNSMMVKVAKDTKHEALRFQLMKVSYAFASVVFIPLGTFASIFLSVDVLIFIVVLFAIVSIIPLIFCKID